MGPLLDAGRRSARPEKPAGADQGEACRRAAGTKAGLDFLIASPPVFPHSTFPIQGIQIATKETMFHRTNSFPVGRGKASNVRGQESIFSHSMEYFFHTVENVPI